MYAKVGKLFIATLLSLFSVTAFAALEYNMKRGVTPISQDIYWLHMTIFWVCVTIGVVVFGVMIYSLFRHRKSQGAKAAVFHEHPKVEFAWTIIPLLILVAMAIPATTVLMTMDDTQDADVTIKITGHQWKWEYQYLDQNISFFSNLSTPRAQIEGKEKKGKWYLLEVDNPLVLPVDRKIRFLVTSNDVIHSWWVPDLGIKRDAVPGFIYEAWARIDEPGTYRGQCAELCGIYHGYMPIVVEAVEEEEFNQWVAEHALKREEEAAAVESDKEWTYEELMEKGEVAYGQSCAMCHGANGEGIPPLFPALQASSISVGQPISRHIDVVLNGVSGSAMQAFKDQLNDVDLAAIITYERNAWQNNTGNVVQPSDVQAQRTK